MKEILFIIYVKDQEESKLFYERLFQLAPTLDVPGMTEFQLNESVRLGIMPEDGMEKILGEKMPHPNKGSGIPRCELYIPVQTPQDYLERGIKLGASSISSLQLRNWGDEVGYIADGDGHVIAFAKARPV